MKYLIAIAISLSLFACKGKMKAISQTADVFYTCSMHPQVMQDQPGKCPICGMELIAVKKTKGQNENSITLSDQQIQLGNIQIDTLGMGAMGDETVLAATLNVDETKSSSISARVSGRIEKLYFNNQGEFIPSGAKLYDLYSEELNNAKQEYILTLEKQETLDNTIIVFKQLVEAAKNKLMLWGMSEAQINELAKTKKTSSLTSFYSSASGYITTLESREGDYVTEGATVVRVANLTSLWAEAQVYTSELWEIDHYGEAVVRFPDLAGKEITGKIEFVNPEVNPDTRINLIRVSVPNSGKQLKPGMQAYVLLKNRRQKFLTLPTDAVIRGERMSIVWIQIDKNTFKHVMVETGMEGNGLIEIRSGLREGDIVVINGAYLINSEYIFKKGSSPIRAMDMNN